MEIDGQSFSVKTSDGRRRTVYVLDEVGEPPDTRFAGFPPHTFRMVPAAKACRGENFHGSLDEDLYVVLDDPSDPSRYVMWVGCNGSQVDDDVPRLVMVGWCDLPNEDEEGPDYEGWPTFLKPATEALLYGYLRFSAPELRSIDEFDIQCSEGGVLTDECVNAMLAQAIQDVAEETIARRR
jgi:hypothetical protein